MTKPACDRFENMLLFIAPRCTSCSTPQTLPKPPSCRSRLCRSRQKVRVFVCALGAGFDFLWRMRGGAGVMVSRCGLYAACAQVVDVYIVQSYPPVTAAPPSWEPSWAKKICARTCHVGPSSSLGAWVCHLGLVKCRWWRCQVRSVAGCGREST